MTREPPQPGASTAPAGTPAASTFTPAERRLLLQQPGIGPRVLQRLERAGYCSLDAIRRQGVERVISRICSDLGTGAWANRRRPIEQALASLPLRQTRSPPADAQPFTRWCATGRLGR